HQQLRSVQRTGAKDYLVRRTDTVNLTPLSIGKASHPVAIELKSLHVRLGNNRQIWSAHSRAQVGICRTASTSAPDRRLKDVKSFLLGTIVVLRTRKPCRARRIQAGSDQRIVVRSSHRGERALPAAEIILPTLP